MNDHYCQYYQARVIPKTAWFVVGYFRSEEHLVFERALEGTDVFEFFVPSGYEQQFCSIMDGLMRAGYVTACTKMDNRIEQEHAAAQVG